MYKLVIQTYVPDVVTGPATFTQINSSLEDHLLWRQVVSFSNDSVIDYNLNIQHEQEPRNFIVSTETWEFSSADDLNEFYRKMNSDDSAENLNRPYSMDSLNTVFKNAQLNRVDKIVAPDGSEEVLFELDKI